MEVKSWYLNPTNDEKKNKPNVKRALETLFTHTLFRVQEENLQPFSNKTTAYRSRFHACEISGRV